MNQLEHLKALRDKARIQTEQAEAVLKQQGEISESLDRLIAALEETEDGDVVGIDKISLAKASGTALAAVGVPPLVQKDIDPILDVSDDAEASAEEGAAPEKTGVAESLGQLIANLEETPGDNVAASGITPVSDAGSSEDQGNEIRDASQDRDSVEWVSDESDQQEDHDEKATPPRLEPIVWEVSDDTPVAAADEAETGPPVGNLDESPREESGDGDYKFVKLGEDNDAAPSDAVADDDDEIEDSEGNFPLKGIAAAGVAAVAVGASRLLGGDDSEEEEGIIDRIKETGSDLKDGLNEKVGDGVDAIKEEAGIEEKDSADVSDSDEVSDSDDTAPLPPLPRSLGITPVAASLNEVEEDQEGSSEEIESAMPASVPVPPSAPPPVPVLVPPVTAPGPVAPPPVPKQEEDSSDDGQFEGAHSSNIFFDANSAYLKESELTKLKTIADAVAGSEARVVKIQGLEDLASSNDFKELLASRRLLAVRKRLAENGLEESQLTIGEIKLSDEGRVLEPPSISLVPA